MLVFPPPEMRVLIVLITLNGFLLMTIFYFYLPWTSQIIAISHSPAWFSHFQEWSHMRRFSINYAFECMEYSLRLSMAFVNTGPHMLRIYPSGKENNFIFSGLRFLFVPEISSPSHSCYAYLMGHSEHSSISLRRSSYIILHLPLLVLLMITNTS